MSSENMVQTKLGKEIMKQLKIDPEELSSDQQIELKVKDIVDNLSPSYFTDKKDPEYDERVIN